MKLIAAVDRNWGIGLNNKLLISIPEDMKFFRGTTTGHVIVMGRKTLESLPGKKGLTGRRNLVLTRDPNFEAPDTETVHTPLQAVFATGAEDFCIGGESVYRALLPACDRVFVTKVLATAEDADAFFPNLDEDPEWRIESVSEILEENGVRFQYVDYVRVEQE
jgi:dihydrofolate reductase